MYAEGRYHLIPSFFRTISSLKKQKREFAVCFRTFGKDLPLVIWEFNQFCAGQHPCYSGRNGTHLIKFDGSKGTKDFRIQDPDQNCIYYRFSDELQDAKLVTGINQRFTNEKDELEDKLENDDRFEDCKQINDSIPQFMHFTETLKKRSTMAVQEDHFHWNENDEPREMAKLLLIDQADYQTQHIFFDDNIKNEEDCIVDVRDAITKEVIPYRKMLNRYAVQVQPHRAILEGDYFLKQIALAE